jgi:hypothetical protein
MVLGGGRFLMSEVPCKGPKGACLRLHSLTWEDDGGPWFGFSDLGLHVDCWVWVLGLGELELFSSSSPPFKEEEEKP